MGGNARPPAVAGTFYPDDPVELRSMIAEFLDKAALAAAPGVPRAMVVPHAGYIYSGPVAACGYKLLSGHSGGVRRVILLGPSHYGAFFGAAESGSECWETPLGVVNTWSLKAELRNSELITVIPEVHAPEHSLEVQIPFLQSVMKDGFSICPMLTGDVSPKALADALAPALDKNTFLIASSDLSHYHTYDDAVSTDSIANYAIPKLDFERLKGAEACGMTAIRTLMHIAKLKGWEGRMLDYRNSGDTAGDRARVVGYGCYAFCGGE